MSGSLRACQGHNPQGVCGLESAELRRLVVYVHGRGGSAKEAEHYRALFPESDVIGFDYRSQSPWEAHEEFPRFFSERRRRYGLLVLVAHSMGAFLALSSLGKRHVDEAYLVSPIVDMEKLIRDMMARAGVTEEELSKRLEIETGFGERLSWKYLCYVRDNPIRWGVPTHILCGEGDDLTPVETTSAFAGQIGADLSVMRGGEHWFHTREQLRFLDAWLGRLKRAGLGSGECAASCSTRSTFPSTPRPRP